MFLNRPTNSSSGKKAVYLLATTILGVLLSFIIHAFIEISYLSWAEKRGILVPFYGNCALPPVLQIGLLLLGIMGGFFLGRFWWRKVYVEKKW